ncbi:MAG: hypothetical protein G3W58_22845 [Pantoea ananatis]|nr:hypothetical protein [Pantoea ananatis]
MNNDVDHVEMLVDALTKSDPERGLKLLLVSAVQYMAKLGTTGVEIKFAIADGKTAKVNIEVEVEE